MGEKNSIKKTGKKKIIHLIANSHIDPVWLWRWDEGYSETVRTFECMIRLLKEYPALTFTRSNASSYIWVEQACPDLMEDIKQLVNKKKWSVVGGWWEQSDCNLPHGESFVRQALYGKNYFRKKFGINVKIGYNPDSFGHNGNLPQILKKSGIYFYLFCRPDKNEKSLPQVFWWKGPDGSRVLACRPPTHYWTSDDVLEKLIRETSANFYEDLEDAVCLFGVGNHGGGPTRKSLSIIERLRKDKNLPELRYSTLEVFFEKILKKRKDFPVIKEELQYHARGCYSTCSQLKKLNRLAEHKILTAETISAFLWQVKKESCPKEEIEKTWREILFNQFHDILPGSSIPEACEDSIKMLGNSIITSERIINEKLWHFSNEINTENKAGSPILFFNPVSFSRKEIKEVSFQPEEGVFYSGEVDFFDGKGKRIPSQSVKDKNSELKNFLVETKMPSFGYNIYWWKPSCRKRKSNKLILHENYLENQKFILRLDKKTAGIKSLKIKNFGLEVFKGIGAEYLVVEDPGDSWAHDIDSFRKIVGKFECDEIIKGEEGECLISLRTKMRFNKSEILQEYLVYNNLPYIEVRLKINWQEKNKILKISFPVNLKNTKTCVEIPYAYSINKPDGKENYCHRWVDLSGKWKNKNFGLSIINDSWYGYDVYKNELRMSVLRSPVFGSFQKPNDLNAKEFHDYQSQGINEFKYLILPHKADWKNINTPKFATFFNQPTEYILPVSSKGKLPTVDSFIKVNPQNIIGAVFKKGEKGNFLVLRLYETFGKNTIASLRIFRKTFRVKFGKFEIKTLKIERGEDKVSIHEIDLLEKPINVV